MICRSLEDMEISKEVMDKSRIMTFSTFCIILSHFFSEKILMFFFLFLIGPENVNIKDEASIEDTSWISVFDDNHFRFSEAFHGLDWKQIAKSCNPSLSTNRIDYLLSVAGAFSLNPLLLITTTIVDDELNMSPTMSSYDNGFFRVLKRSASDLLRYNLDGGKHPKYNQAVASIWNIFQHDDQKVAEFLRVYEQLYTKHGLESRTRPNDKTVELREEKDLNHTLQWPWTPGECWELSATHGGAVEGLSGYVPASLDMAPSLYMDWLQNYNHLGSSGSVQASHDGNITIHSTCNVEVTDDQYSTYYAHIKVLDGLNDDDYVQQGDVLGHIELRPDEALCLCDWASKSFSCSTGPHLHWEVRRNHIPISIDNLVVGNPGIHIRAGTYERDATCTDPEHCQLAKKGGSYCATYFSDDDHNVYCPAVRGNTGNMI